MLINELLGIKYPIFQGAMANIATPEFAAAYPTAAHLALSQLAPWMSTRHGRQSVPVSS